MLQGREKLCYGNRLRAGCVFEEVTHFWLTLAMNQYHNTLCRCFLCWDLKKFEGQSIKISQKYKPGRQAPRSLHSSINVTKICCYYSHKANSSSQGKLQMQKLPKKLHHPHIQPLIHSTLQNSTGLPSCLKYQHFCEPL